ncbi:hypothetical protein M501DRAFT_1016690 [Patellaria atrata CBS 101060]|uniref:Nucleoporin NUP37 n=1 Tax=Patellaria atrata CBS 101060 TaxID=1346257 RepID=A0A9P4SB46_9PEZI|nr:hypothetical protein M501DRAFT_1016690 [Patellaria atrata CBS 101060]
MSALPVHRVLKKGKTAQLCYDLPHRITEAKVYPVTAPNGSTIIIYGRSNGITVLWSGGRSLKKRKASEAPQEPETNGNNEDAIMIIDSDEEEEAPTKRKADNIPDAEFESEEEETDFSESYPPIVQRLTLPLGTQVLHIAIPSIPIKPSIKGSNSLPQMFYDMIVFSVACADNSIKILTLPLSPPSNEAIEQETVGEGIVNISGPTGHQRVPDGLSMAWTAREPLSPVHELEEDDTMEIDATPTSKAFLSRSHSHPRNTQWDLVLASHSTELSGIFHIFRVPVTLDGDDYMLERPTGSSFTQYLSSPAASVTFSPAHYPSKKHLQLLIVESKGAVRIFNPLAPSRARPRSSRQETDSRNKVNRGSWVASFLTPFDLSKSKTTSADMVRRKRILSAQWTTNGSSVLMLLSDGEWGIWDFEGSGPSPPGASFGASALTFSMRGFIGAATRATHLKKPKSGRLSLEPATPNTRRVKEEALFSGSKTLSSSTVMNGGISVRTCHPLSGHPDESVIIWFGDEVYRIPQLHQFWSRSVSSGGGTGSLYGPGLSHVDGIKLFNERISHIDQFPIQRAAARVTKNTDLLIAAESRLLIHMSSAMVASANAPLFAKEKEADNTASVDQSLLLRGELDTVGLDRVMESMGSLGTAPRRVGFAA